jgi:uracil-DNA glycosylase
MYKRRPYCIFSCDAPMIHCSIERFDTWRHAALKFLREEIPPHSICWMPTTTRAPFFGIAAAADRGGAVEVEISPDEPLWSAAEAERRVTGLLLERIEKAACHRDPDRWGLFYRLLWRMSHGESTLLNDRGDADVRRLTSLRRTVTLAVRRMEAAVSFANGLPGAGDYALAWYRPEHAVLRLVAPHLVQRFPLGNWALLTPDESAEWDGRLLQFGPGVPLDTPPRPAELVREWQAYRQQSFRPDRITVHGSVAAEPQPLGSGRRALLFVTASEQSTEEAGRARQILREALADVGIGWRRVALIDLADLTGAAHGDEMQGRTRPARRAIEPLRERLAAELVRLRPRMLVSLGAVASQTLFGREFRVSRQHGQVFASRWSPWTMATYHPAALVRVPDSTVRARMHEQFLYDLHRIAEALPPAVNIRPAAEMPAQ